MKCKYKTTSGSYDTIRGVSRGEVGSTFFVGAEEDVFSMLACCIPVVKSERLMTVTQK